MKTKIITALFAVITLIGCKKDEDTPPAKVYPEENPLSLYLTNSGFNQHTDNTVNYGTKFESGFKFRPKVKGKINAITFKIPDNASNVWVTIWNADTQAVLRTIVIPAVTANVEIKQNIDVLNIDPSTAYTISYNGDDWYLRRRTDYSNVIYPIDAGNISILSYNYKEVSTQTYPNNIQLNYYVGDLSIVFQQTD